MKLAILATLTIGATAFAPSPKVTTRSMALNADLAKEVGAQAPLGFFDPAGYATEENFDTYRYIELKHGRVAMLAVVGYLTTYSGVRLPGLEGTPSGFAAWSAVPADVWFQMVATWTM